MAYVVTLTLSPENVAGVKVASNPGLRVLFGLVDVSTYNSTNVEISGITKHFSNTSPHVVIDGISDNGFMGRWDPTNGTIVCYALDGTLSVTASSTSLTEAQDGVDVGVFNFIAIGLG